MQAVGESALSGWKDETKAKGTDNTIVALGGCTPQR